MKLQKVCIKDLRGDGGGFEMSIDGMPIENVQSYSISGNWDNPHYASLKLKMLAEVEVEVMASIDANPR